MSLNLYLQSNGDMGSSFLMTAKRCAKALADSGSPRPKLVEQCVGYDRCGPPHSKSVVHCVKAKGDVRRPIDNR